MSSLLQIEMPLSRTTWRYDLWAIKSEIRDGPEQGMRNFCSTIIEAVVYTGPELYGTAKLRCACISDYETAIRPLTS